MCARFIALLGVLLALSGCSGGHRDETPLPRGTSLHTIAFGGLDRTYHLYRPAGLPAAAPLVIMLHGGFGSGKQAENSYGWDANGRCRDISWWRTRTVRTGPGTPAAAAAGPGRTGRRRRGVPHRDGRRDQGAGTARRPPDLRHRDQQRRHHGVHPRLPHHPPRRDRSGLGHPARRLRHPGALVGDPHPRHGRPEHPLRRRDRHGRRAHRRPGGAGPQRHLAGHRPVRRADRHDRPPRRPRAPPAPAAGWSSWSPSPGPATSGPAVSRSARGPTRRRPALDATSTPWVFFAAHPA